MLLLLVLVSSTLAPVAAESSDVVSSEDPPPSSGGESSSADEPHKAPRSSTSTARPYRRKTSIGLHSRRFNLPRTSLTRGSPRHAVGGRCHSLGVLALQLAFRHHRGRRPTLERRGCLWPRCEGLHRMELRGRFLEPEYTLEVSENITVDWVLTPNHWRGMHLPVKRWWKWPKQPGTTAPTERPALSARSV